MPAELRSLPTGCNPFVRVQTKDATIGKIDFDLVLFDEPNRMSLGRLKTPAAIIAAANQNRFAHFRRVHPQVKERLLNGLANLRQQFEVAHKDLTGNERGLSTSSAVPISHLGRIVAGSFFALNYPV